MKRVFEPHPEMAKLYERPIVLIVPMTKLLRNYLWLLREGFPNVRIPSQSRQLNLYTIWEFGGS